MATMTVKQLASRAGTAPETIRYYTKIGLLPEPPRSDNGYRQFPAEAADRVGFIKRLQRLGLRLHAIRTLLRVRDEGGCPCGSAHRMLRDRLTEVDRELKSLGELREEIAGVLARLPDPSGADGGGSCPPELHVPYVPADDALGASPATPAGVPYDADSPSGNGGGRSSERHSS